MRISAMPCRSIGLSLFFLGAGMLSATPTMSISNTVGTPGATVPAPINVTIDTNVVSLQFDLWFGTNYLASSTPTGGSALSDQQVFSALVQPGDLRVLEVSFDDSPMTNGVAAYVPFTIASNAPDHDESLMLSNVILVNAGASEVPVIVNSNGTLSITIPPRFTAIYPTNGGAIHLDLSGGTNRVYTIQAATNLAQPAWIGLSTNTNFTGVLPVDDTNASNFLLRFYRAQFDH
jgi:hypothetical protein